MKTLNALVRLVISMYLCCCLWLGCHRHAYRLTKRLGSKYYGITWIMQLRLFDLGYHQCPSCYWATEKPNEHLADRGSWCYQESLPLCPVCYERMEKGKECANCKINQEIEEQQRKRWMDDALSEAESDAEAAYEDEIRYREAVDSEFDRNWEKN